MSKYYADFKRRIAKEKAALTAQPRSLAEPPPPPVAPPSEAND
jgi:hypothetical protein